MRIFKALIDIIGGALIGGFIAFVAPIILLRDNLSGLVGLLLAPVGVLAGGMAVAIFWLQRGGRAANGPRAFPQNRDRGEHEQHATKAPSRRD